jgi:hypothetical protein
MMKSNTILATESPIPVVVVDSNGDQVSSFSGGGGGGGGAVTISDGSDIAQGAIADAVVSAGASGTVSAKLRRLTTDLDAVKTIVGTSGITVATSALPSGAATAANQSTANTTLSAISGKFGALGQTTMSGSAPVVLASDQSAVSVKGASTGSTVPTTAFYIAMNDLSSGNLVGARAASNTTNTGSGILGTGMLAALDDTSPTAITENNFGAVRMSTDRSLLVAHRATTPTVSSVAASASSVTVLAANANRKGAIITNDSSAILYLKFGATASTSSYTVTVAGSGSAPFSNYEVPFGYIGVIDGIWASATGNARVTEIV